MLVMSPVVPIATVEKQETFLDHVRSIGKHTLQHEPDCLAYFWLKSIAEADNSVCGFEIYANPEALAVVHRNSAPYLNFQTALRTERLAPTPKPSDLIARQKVGLGFQTRSLDIETLNTSDNLVIRSEYSNETEEQAQDIIGSWEGIVERLRRASTCLGVQAFRIENSNEVMIIERYTSIEDQQISDTEISNLRAVADKSALSVKRTMWKSAGVGFIRHDA